MIYTNRPGRFVWLEEYRGCGCSQEFTSRQKVKGYCGQHGTDRRRLTKIPRAEWKRAAAAVAAMDKEEA